MIITCVLFCECNQIKCPNYCNHLRIIRLAFGENHTDDEIYYAFNLNGNKKNNWQGVSNQTRWFIYQTKNASLHQKKKKRKMQVLKDCMCV